MGHEEQIESQLAGVIGHNHLPGKGKSLLPNIEDYQPMYVI